MATTTADKAFAHGLAISVDFGRNANAVLVGCPYLPVPMLVDAYVDALGTVASAKDAGEAMRRVYRSLPEAGVFLLEEQSKINSETPMMESALSALAATRPGTLVVHVPVSRVKREFALPTGHTEKKKGATALAERMLRDPTRLLVAPEVRERMELLARKHDLADALLQFVWFARRGKQEVVRPALGASARVVRATDPARKGAEETRVRAKSLQKRKAERALVHKNPVARKKRKVTHEK